MSEPTAPSQGEATFDSMADAFLAALPGPRSVIPPPPQRDGPHPGSVPAFGTAAYRRWLWTREP